MTSANPFSDPARAPGAALLSLGFRPFFALAAVAAVLLPALWLMQLTGWRWPGAPAAPLAWHAHEMLYGFVSAAIAGFLLTAVPGFTGRPPLVGMPLAGLAVLWLLARLAAAFAGALPAWVVAVADIGFLLVLAALAGRDIVLAGNRRNLVLVALVVLLAAAATGSHLQWRTATPLPGLHVVLLLITVLGGRIIPSFTGNWLRAKDGYRPPVRRLPLEVAVLAATVLAGLLDILAPPAAAGVAAAVAAGLHLARLAGWRGWATRREPLLFVLHAGYAWLAVGYVLLALAGFGLVAKVAALHAFGLGAIGTMILAVMSRAALGHTGRALRAPGTAVVAFWLVSLAALTRVAATLWPGTWSLLVPVSGLAWMSGFALFLAGYLPMLLRPRVD